MRVRFWGTRGSIATPGAGTIRYGGNTSCVELRSASGAIIVLDCGTGARLLGHALAAEAAERDDTADGCLFIGHTHWDHIQGIPFFAPLFGAGNQWDIYGPRGLGQSLGKTLAGQMQYQYFPVSVDQLGATVTYHDLVEGTFTVGDLTVTTKYLNHPALTLGYRIDGDDVSVAYICDHEPFDPTLAHGGDVVGSNEDAAHVDFLSGVDLLVHDAQYLAEEYDAKRGWGHSTPEYCVEVARAAGVGELVLTHHEPLRDDDGIDVLVTRARDYAARVGYAGVVTAAAEGSDRQVRAREGSASQPRPQGQSATYQPTETELHASVVVASGDSDVRAAVQAAASAEHLPVMESEELPDDRQVDAVLVVDHDDRGVFERVQQAIAASPPARLAVLALTRGRPTGHGDDVVTDWLVWPASTGHLRTKLRAAVLRRACRWQSAPLPPDEEQRLRAVRALNLLDTAPEERFDRHTRLACQDLDMPMALVSLVDGDRQWFKSRQGISDEETPRDESVCAHAILGADVFQVPDMLDDDRFADSPVVTGANQIRFYAGVPLRAPDGSRVGTLCVADRQPRLLGDDELARLRELAEQVEAELRA